MDILPSLRERERRIKLGRGKVRPCLLHVERHVVHARRKRRTIELGDDVTCLDDGTFRNDRRDLGLGAETPCLNGRSRDLNELARSEFTGA